MATIRTDELNVLSYESYFGEMDITKLQKEARIRCAEAFEDILFYLFSVIEDDLDSDNPLNRYKYYKIAENEIVSVLESLGYDTKEDYERLNNYPERLSEMIVDATVDNIESKKETSDVNQKSENYWLSNQRAKNISADQANAVLNTVEFEDAVKSGKTIKTWHTIMDGRERNTHADSNFQEAPINEPFFVGNSWLMYPRDISLDADPKEVINCRCSAKYE